MAAVRRGIESLELLSRFVPADLAGVPANVLEYQDARVGNVGNPCHGKIAQNAAQIVAP